MSVNLAGVPPTWTRQAQTAEQSHCMQVTMNAVEQREFCILGARSISRDVVTKRVQLRDVMPRDCTANTTGSATQGQGALANHSHGVHEREARVGSVPSSRAQCVVMRRSRGMQTTCSYSSSGKNKERKRG